MCKWEVLKCTNCKGGLCSLLMLHETFPSQLIILMPLLIHSRQPPTRQFRVEYSKKLITQFNPGDLLKNHKGDCRLTLILSYVHTWKLCRLFIYSITLFFYDISDLPSKLTSFTLCIFPTCQMKDLGLSSTRKFSFSKGSAVILSPLIL